MPVFGLASQLAFFARSCLRAPPHIHFIRFFQRATYPLRFMTDAILNLDHKDPFAEAESEFQGQGSGYVHIRIQQRNNKKTLTTLQGLPNDLDFKRILKAFKKNFCCNGHIVRDPELGKVIQLQGDQRQGMYDFLIEQEICGKDSVKVHGF